MGASFGVELLKLRKRPATWVLGLVFAALVILFGYLLNYVLFANADGELLPEAEQFLASLYPGNVLPTVLQSFGDFGAAVALILGALAVGSEYGWETLKLSLTQRLSRISFFSGKLLAVGVVLTLFTLLMFAVGAISSYVVANLQDASIDWPSFVEAAKALGAGWLILAVFAAMGVFLAALFRGSGLAIGLGLVYLLVLEGLFLAIPAESETFRTISKALPVRNVRDLTVSFGETPQGFVPPGGLIEPAQAALMLGAYVIGFSILAALLFQRRDVV